MEAIMWHLHLYHFLVALEPGNDLWSFMGRDVVQSLYPPLKQDVQVEQAPFAGWGDKCRRPGKPLVGGSYSRAYRTQSRLLLKEHHELWQ